MKVEFLVTFERSDSRAQNDAIAEQIEAMMGREAFSVDTFDRSVDVLFHLGEKPQEEVLNTLRGIPRFLTMLYGDDPIG